MRKIIIFKDYIKYYTLKFIKLYKLKFFNEKNASVGGINGQHEYRPGFFNLGIDILDPIIFCCGGLPCALWDVEQHPWPLLSRCQ